MKQVKPNMTNKTVYIQTFDLLEHSNRKLFGIINIIIIKIIIIKIINRKLFPLSIRLAKKKFS